MNRVGRAICLCALLVLSVSPAWAKTEARCGLSAGIVAGPSLPHVDEVKDEFDYLLRIEANAKYYFLYVLSISGDLGYEYGQGAPHRLIHDGEQIELDGPGTSFWRAMPVWGTLRLEPFRRFNVNPYVGGAVGYKYLVMERRGKERLIPISDSADEWIFHWAALAGFDAYMSDFVFFRLEGRYSSGTPTQDFFMDKDLGTFDVSAGINIYF